MKIDTSKLENVVRKSDGSVVARCPACSKAGADKKGDHLFINTVGAFGCVVHSKDKAHNQEIFKLAGADDDAGEETHRIKIKPFHVPDSTVITSLGRLGQRKPAPAKLADGGLSMPSGGQVNPTAEPAVLPLDRFEYAIPGGTADMEWFLAN